MNCYVNSFFTNSNDTPFVDSPSSKIQYRKGDQYSTVLWGKGHNLTSHSSQTVQVAKQAGQSYQDNPTATIRGAESQLSPTFTLLQTNSLFRKSVVLARRACKHTIQLKPCSGGDSYSVWLQVCKHLCFWESSCLGKAHRTSTHCINHKTGNFNEKFYLTFKAT